MTRPLETKASLAFHCEEAEAVVVEALLRAHDLPFGRRTKDLPPPSERPAAVRARFSPVSVLVPLPEATPRDLFPGAERRQLEPVLDAVRTTPETRGVGVTLKVGVFGTDDRILNAWLDDELTAYLGRFGVRVALSTYP